MIKYILLLMNSDSGKTQMIMLTEEQLQKIVLHFASIILKNEILIKMRDLPSLHKELIQTITSNIHVSKISLLTKINTYFTFLCKSLERKIYIPFEDIKTLIDLKFDINYSPSSGKYTLLNITILFYTLDDVIFLVENGALINRYDIMNDFNFKPAIMYAFERKDYNIIDFLIDKGVDYKITSGTNTSILNHALSKCSSYPRMKELIELDPFIYNKNIKIHDHKFTFFIYSGMCQNRIEILTIALEKGLNVSKNIIDFDPLLWLISNNHDEIKYQLQSLLIQYGASISENPFVIK